MKLIQVSLNQELINRINQEGQYFKKGKGEVHH